MKTTLRRRKEKAESEKAVQEDVKNLEETEERNDNKIYGS